MSLVADNKYKILTGRLTPVKPIYCKAETIFSDACLLYNIYSGVRDKVRDRRRHTDRCTSPPLPLDRRRGNIDVYICILILKTARSYIIRVYCFKDMNRNIKWIEPCSNKYLYIKYARKF